MAGKAFFRLVVLAVVVALGIWTWGYFFPSPQKAMEEDLTKLARFASFPPNQGNFNKLADMERIRALLAENVHVTLGGIEGAERTFDNREELLQAALAARSMVKGLQVKFGDIHITLNADKVTAVAMLTLKANVTGETDPQVAELKFTFKKVESSWLITSIEPVKPYK